MTLEDFQDWAQDHKILMCLFVIILVIFVVGNTVMINNKNTKTSKKSNIENIEVIKSDNDITPFHALTKCYNKVHECYDIPAIRAEMRTECYNIWYYTADVDSIMELTENMC